MPAKARSPSYADVFTQFLDLQVRPGGPALREEIERYITLFSENRASIETGEIPDPIVRTTVVYMCTGSGHERWLRTQIETLLQDHDPVAIFDHPALLLDIIPPDGKYFEPAKANLTSLPPKLARLWNILIECSPAARLPRFLAEFSKILDSLNGIGFKGRSNILRDCGFFDAVPIDIHEKRFLIRTGIYHLYAAKGYYDPVKDEHLAQIVKDFCAQELCGVNVGGIPLSSAPGIVDLIIFKISASRDPNVTLRLCGRTPKCERCPGKQVCWFGMRQARI